MQPLEFFGRRSKMYSLLLPDTKENKTAKGVKRSYVAKQIPYAHNRYCLQKEQTTKANFNTLWSLEHVIHTTNTIKTALSPCDDKRYLEDFKNSLAYGHCKIAKKNAV